ncbi:hypothetical protein QBC37DRAFT_434863 [Rhypophila decipiens]|uniref:Uncharacterized protein n=1 Tax=Rhypophila decipiens TaxID=261697 RepID=A0AAN7B335_9PEZI|nr:hypothetical protein QBC37DRAFT_434863 [Rhypophila decipiens]
MSNTTSLTTSTSPATAIPTSLLPPKCDGPPYNAQPDIRSIPTLPKDINIAMIGGENVSHPAMVRCCYPNHVQLLDSCYLWCQIPEPGDSNNEKDSQGRSKFSHAQDIAHNFTSCLTHDPAFNGSENRGIQWHIPNSAPPGSGRVALGSLAIGLLVVTSFVMG